MPLLQLMGTTGEAGAVYVARIQVRGHGLYERSQEVHRDVGVRS